MRSLIYNLFSVICTTLLLTSCQEYTVSEYCPYKANMAYHGDLTPLQPLNDALASDNTFAIVYISKQLGTTYDLTAQLYGKSAETRTISIASQVLPTLGLENTKGFFIGKTSMRSDNPYVFDRICPNCYLEYRNTKYVLSFENETTVKCGTCKRVYSLLNGGLVTAGDNGNKLFRYRVTGYTADPPFITIFQ
ncbi:MAG: hypothetical protein IJ782_01620 [Prevotella sp.]|nr:hypothetical protein [Prevotella sp.]